jgi:hypothetical protein
MQIKHKKHNKPQKKKKYKKLIDKKNNMIKMKSQNIKVDFI